MCYPLRMDERVGWYWNRRWGRLARRDVKIYSDGRSWHVEAVQGGVEGRVRRFDDLDESGAKALADNLMSESDGWQDMMPVRDT